MPKKGQIIDRTGEESFNTHGRKMKIVECFGIANNTVEFDNGHRAYNINYRDFKTGQVSNPYDLTVYGVGYKGEGRHLSKINGKHTTVYSKWIKMFQRSYGGEHIKGNKTYIECTVDPIWHNFQVFGDWFEENFNYNTMQGWNLDKDIKIKNNKIYSPETCLLLPQRINKLFTKRQNGRGNCPIGVTTRKGRFEVSFSRFKEFNIKSKVFYNREEAFSYYKYWKEIIIKKVADEWRPLIGEDAYSAMINYKVEITD